MAIEAEEYATAPGTPPANIVLLYAKTDGRWYGKDDTGAEFALSAPPLPLSIANGGTGQVTAAAARGALGAAESGANGDITSLTGLTTPLSIAQGGTSGATAAAARNAILPDQSSQAAKFLQTDGAEVSWQSVSAGAGVFSEPGFLAMKDDFPSNFDDPNIIGELGWAPQRTGTATAVVRKSGVSGNPGIITLRPGTGAGGRAAIGLGGDGVDMMVLGDGVTELTWVVRCSQVLSGFEMLVLGLGALSNNVGNQANGVYFQLLGSPAPDTNWHLVAANGGVRTRVDTGIAYASGGWIKLKFTVNAGATSVQANINGTDAGAPITTNIPTGAVSPIAKVDGIAGGSAGDTDIDWVLIKKTLTTTR